MVFLHFTNTWKPTIINFKVSGMNKKKMDQKQKKWSSPTFVIISNLFGIFSCYPKNGPH
jgi:hypothetical protein